MSEPMYDIAVIGAGISGLAFARFYLDIHPQCRLAIIEEDSCVGGVWSASRSYDQFWTQTGRRMVGFSDKPIVLPAEAPTFHGTFEAKHFTQYLENYIDRHVYDGACLRSRIHFGSRVTEIQKADNVWTTIVRSFNAETQNFRSSKLVLAAGLTSLPKMPILPNQHDYLHPICHHKDFGQATKSFLSEPSSCNIVVLGAGKSATDMVYECVKRGKSVHWIIRKDGEGPALYFPAPGGGKFENSTEQGATRLAQTFSPSSFMQSSWLATAVHGTMFGRRYLDNKIREGDESCRKPAAYRDRDGALSSFRNPECTTSAFWCTGPLGLAQHDDFWDTLAKNVRIYRNNVRSMKQSSIILDDESEILADAVLCGTGWSSAYPFFSSDQARSLGLPHLQEEDSDEEAKLWESLLRSADERVLYEFPMLAHPPPHKVPETSTTTARLYNCIAPLEDDSIAFLGRAHMSNSFRTSEAQAIWATAYFDKNVKMPTTEKARENIAYMNAFSRRRYPSHGAAGDYLFFELIWYTDKLLEEAGIKSHRKGWWSDLLDPCLITDFKDTVAEYKEKFGL